MSRPVVAGLGALLSALTSVAMAQPATPGVAAAVPPAAAPAPDARGLADRAPETPEPAVQRRVLEDDQTRIEELRVRGVNRRLLVQPKMAGVSGYEILPEEPGRDAADRRAAGGQRVWRLLSF
jgi:hypothetical protein